MRNNQVKKFQQDHLVRHTLTMPAEHGLASKVRVEALYRFLCMMPLL